MKKILLAIMFAVTLFGSTALPVQAAVGIPEYLTPKDTPLYKFNSKLTQAAKSGVEDLGTKGINTFLQLLVNILLYVAAPIAVMFVAHGGQNYAFAMGEQGKLDAAKREITWALLGLVTILFAYILVRWMIATFYMIPTGTVTDGATTTSTSQSKDAGMTEQEKIKKYCVEGGMIYYDTGKKCP